MSTAEQGSEPTRRDFLYIGTAGVGAVLTGSAVWPLVNQMNPDASVRSLASIDVDIGSVQEGSQLVVTWRGKPVFVRRRTSEEIAEARAVALSDLPDEASRNANAEDEPATDEARSFGENGEWVIMVGVCTHLGCVPSFNGGDFGGWYCPCHASHYDVAGRVRRGPAPENLPIPVVTFLEETKIRIG